jgi:phosphoribosylformylglycinamidine synthase
VPAVLLGYSGSDSLIIEGLVSLPLAEIRQAHEGWLPAYMDAVE